MKMRFLLVCAVAGTVAVLAAEKNEGVTLENPSLRLQFDAAEAGFGVRRIESRLGGGAAFVNPADKAGIWRLVFRREADGRQVTVDNAAPCRRRRVERRADGGADFLWEGVTIDDEQMAASVRARVAFTAEGESEWSLSVACHSTQWALFETRYPTFDHVAASGEADVLRPRQDTGARLQRKRPWGVAASAGCMGYSPMVCAFFKGGSGLYLAAHDDAARIKFMRISAQNDFWFETPVENAGLVGRAAEGPRYAVTVAALAGDWWVAAKRYRKWALKTKWTSKGPILSRADYPRRLSEIPLWFNIHGDPAEVSNVMTRARAAFPDVEAGIHWHVWQHSKHDINYPEYFPEQVGAGDCFRYLDTIHETALPYTNGRLWSTNLVSFPLVKQYAITRPNGEPVVERYGTLTPPMSPMCPATAAWDGVLNDFSGRVLDLGAHSIFLDQIGACSGIACYSPNHGHSVGGGTWYFEGYQRLLAKTHEMYRNRNAFVTTEGSGEQWMNVIDGYLTVTRRLPDDVPFLQVVYGGYTTYFCSPENHDDDFVSFRAQQTRDLLWGFALGWYHPIILERPDKVALLRKLTAFRQANLDYLVYGSLEGPVEIVGDVEPLKVNWLGRKAFYLWAIPDAPLSPTTTGELPSVLAYVRRSGRDGSTRLFFANLAEKPQTFSFRFDGATKSLSLAAGEIKTVD